MNTCLLVTAILVEYGKKDPGGLLKFSLVLKLIKSFFVLRRDYPAMLLVT